MAEETIVTDVLEDEVETVEEDTKELTARENLVNDLVSQNIKDRDDEAGPYDEIQDEDEVEETVSIKVNDEEMEVSQDELDDAGSVRTLQKEKAADERLREAAARESTLDQRERELKEMEEQLILKQDQQDVDADDYGKEFADALYEDEDKIAKTITSLHNSIKVLQDQNKTREAERVKTKSDENAKVVRHYHKNHNDIASDPDMHMSLTSRLDGVAADNPDFTQTQVIDEAARLVYEKYKVNVEVEDTPENIKDKMPKRPKTASGRKPRKPEKKPKTYSEVLDGMRKGRGIHSY